MNDQQGIQSFIKAFRVSKSYAGIDALTNVTFGVHPGEVHGLVGANGSGKSTLCKVLSGAVLPDDGELLVEGEPQAFRRPSDATNAGIRMVYQSSDLVPTMTVAQNVVLGSEPLAMRLRDVNQEVRQLVFGLNFGVEPEAVVETLSTAQKQMAEIARALYSDVELLILDEPTAALTPEETARLFHVMRELTAGGVGIVFVSHALEEALEITDRITVLRDGERVTTETTREFNRDRLVHLMVGDGAATLPSGSSSSSTEDLPVLRVENLTVEGLLKHVSFSVFKGEVLGITGLVGAGRTEVARVIAGALKRDLVGGGRIYLNDRPVRYRTPTEAVNDGIAYITEDRKRDGIFEIMSAPENIYTGRLVVEEHREAFISPKRERETAANYIDRFNIRSLNPDALVNELSGGNQQKVLIAKSLSQEPEILIFDEPTQGVDVQAIEEIHQFIAQLAAEGKAVVVISSYIPEILALSDRIIVMRGGSVAAQFPRENATQERIMFSAIH